MSATFDGFLREFRSYQVREGFLPAPTIRDGSLDALSKAVQEGRISSEELRTVRDFWRERDGYDASPSSHARDGYFEREEAANAIIRKALG